MHILGLHLEGNNDDDIVKVIKMIMNNDDGIVKVMIMIMIMIIIIIIIKK